MKTKQLRKLVSQFGHLAPDLSADEIADALEAEGLIERLENGRRYAETKVMRGIPPGEFLDTVQSILRRAQTYSRGGRNG